LLREQEEEGGRSTTNYRSYIVSKGAKNKALTPVDVLLVGQPCKEHGMRLELRNYASSHLLRYLSSSKVQGVEMVKKRVKLPKFGLILAYNTPRNYVASLSKP